VKNFNRNLLNRFLVFIAVFVSHYSYCNSNKSSSLEFKLYENVKPNSCWVQLKSQELILDSLEIVNYFETESFREVADNLFRFEYRERIGSGCKKRITIYLASNNNKIFVPIAFVSTENYNGFGGDDYYYRVTDTIVSRNHKIVLQIAEIGNYDKEFKNCFFADHFEISLDSVSSLFVQNKDERCRLDYDDGENLHYSEVIKFKKYCYVNCLNRWEILSDNKLYHFY